MVKIIRVTQRRALLIGVNYNGSPLFEDLFGQDDAQHFREFLIEHRGWREDEIVLMLDADGTGTETESVENTLCPTQTNIRREIRNLVRGLRRGDRCVFFYAGHSDQLPNKRHSEADSMDEVLVPSDCDKELTKAIVDNELRQTLVEALPEGCSLTAIFDSCHSGTMLDLEHDACNAVYVPWQSKGTRRSDTFRNLVLRRDGAETATLAFTGIGGRNAGAGVANGDMAAEAGNATQKQKQETKSIASASTPDASPVRRPLAPHAPQPETPPSILSLAPFADPPSLFLSPSPASASSAPVQAPAPHLAAPTPLLPIAFAAAPFPLPHPHPHTRHIRAALHRAAHPPHAGRHFRAALARQALPPSVAFAFSGPDRVREKEALEQWDLVESRLSLAPAPVPALLARPGAPKRPTVRIDTRPPVRERAPVIAPMCSKSSSWSDLGVLSPEHECLSPEEDFPCNGWCRVPIEDQGPMVEVRPRKHVVSLSACADSQRSWEDTSGKTMTMELIDILREYPECTYTEVLLHLSHRLYHTTRKVHAYSHLMKRIKHRQAQRQVQGGDENRPPGGTPRAPPMQQLPSDDILEMDNFQNPQLSALYPLDMHAPFAL